MSEKIIISGPIAYLSESGTAVYFSNSASNAGEFSSNPKGTAIPVKNMQNSIDVAYWGEDNKFPQNIEQQMAYCGLGKSALDWKARVLWGNGILPGKITGYEDEGKKEIFEPLDPKKYKKVYAFLNNRSLTRFYLEFLQDWTWFANCFPEIILSFDGKQVTGFVHQESCDARYKQMNEQGNFDTVYLSKLWGATKDQYVKFDPKKSIPGLYSGGITITAVDGVYVKALDCIDMYDSLNSLTKIAAKQVKSRKKSAQKSAILPVNYPSVNKTYYQLPAWDGARLAGWVEIAAKVPALIKLLYNKATRIRTHIEIPDTYFADKYGTEVWENKTEPEKATAKKDLLKEMQDFLTGEENAYKTLITFFKVDTHTQNDYGHVKINPVKDDNGLDKDLIISSAANVELLTALGVHPTLFSAGMPGATHKSGGGSGSDIREAYLVYTSLLHLERQAILEPLYLARDYNREVGGVTEWEDDIVFRFRDTILTTLDKGKGTTKTLS